MEPKTLPDTQQLSDELARVRRKSEYRHTLRSTVFILLAVAAAAVLLVMLLMPVLQVTGTSMEPTLESGEILLALKKTPFHQGDVVAFYYNNKILIKRVIALPGDQVSIDADGNVSVNGILLDEPYLTDKSLGDCDLTFPYQVPDGKIFVLGDHRATSVDSRSSALGCIAEEFIVGRVVFRIWPFARWGTV